MCKYIKKILLFAIMKTNFRKKVIAVIGDANIEKNSHQYKLAERLGKALIDEGYRIQHGGMSGIMESVSKGAKQSSNYKEGMVVGIIPGFNPDEANPYVDIVIPTGLNIMRNAIVANADAVIAIGGGAGTLSEMAMAWQMKRMIIAYDVEGWSGKLAGKKIDNKKRVSWEGDKIFKVSNEEQVIDVLNKCWEYY